MTPERWREVSRIYGAVLTKPESDRPTALASLCANDAELRAEVESLLKSGTDVALIDRAATERPSTLGLIEGRAIGSQIGVFRIDGLLGVGGMGEVYRARDTKLNRDVAIKILPPAFANDPERLARFKREAQVLASLNHPNIGGIYGFEDQDGVHALVLELVEGPTLADKLSQGSGLKSHGLPLDEALAIARQICDALEGAHEQGIIHRDLKPANIKVRDDGTVKVLDFGLAKFAEISHDGQAGLTQSPTITTPAMTAAGMILGTAAYMSPEQAKGKPADKRSDMWAFGVVLYEMLTGQRPFKGEDVADTLAHLLTKDPDWTPVPPYTPPAIRRLLMRCLTKDRKRRLPDAAAARLDIDDATSSPAVDPHSAPPSVAPSRSSWTRAVAVAALVVAIGSLGAVLFRSTPQPSKPVLRFPIMLGARQEFAARSAILAVSPDGSRLVYAGDAGQLYLRPLADMDAHPIGGTNLDVMSPFFSPDGQWIGFYSFRDRSLQKVAVTGGTPVVLCKSDPPYGARWEGNRIVFADQGTRGILSVSERGGEPEVLIPVGPGEVFSSPQLLNDGTSVLFTVATSSAADRWDTAQVVIQDVGSKKRTVLHSGSEGVYLPTGHLVFMQGAALRGVPFNPKTMTVTGAPVTIIDGIRRFTANVGSPAASVVFSAAGSLAYIPGSTVVGTSELNLALATRDGAMESLRLPPRTYAFPRISPNGRQIAVQAEASNESVIYVLDLDGTASPRRLTFGGRNRFPVWTPNGRYIAFQSDRDGDRGIFRQLADGSGPAERLSNSEPLVEHRPETWTPDAKTLVFTISPFAGVDFRLHMLSAERPGTSMPFDPDLPARYATLSPDGRWLAYASGELVTQEIFVRPFPRTDAKYQVSTDGGRTPVWSADGTQLYYWANLTQKFTAVAIHTTPTVTIGTATALPVRGVFNTVALARNFDIGPDGKFVVVTRDDGDVVDASRPLSLQINVVINWFDELNRMIPVEGKR